MAITRKSLALLGAVAVLVGACSSAATDAPTSAPTSAPTAAPTGAPTEAPSAPGNECGIEVGGSGPLAALSDGFPSKPLTIINIDDAGAPDGIYALAIKKSIEDNKLTDQRVNVVDRPDFGTYGTWEGLQFMSSSAEGKDGYIMAVQTVPGSTTDLLTTKVMQDLGVTAESTNIVLTTEYVPYAMTSRKGAPWGTSFRDLITYAQEHPNELKYISRGPGSGLDLAFTAWSTVAAKEAGYPVGTPGIPVTTVIGGSHQEINAVVGSGEGDFAMTLSDVAKQFYDDGRVEVITFSGNAPAPAPFTGVPTAKEVFGADLLPNDPWGQNRNLFVTPETPECHRQWLVELITRAVADPTYQQSRNNVPGLSLQTLTREETFELADVAFDQACQILKPLGLLDPTMENAC